MKRETVCDIIDIDIYLLLYLDLDSIINLLAVSKMQYSVLSNLAFVKQFVSLESKHDYLELIK